MTTELSTNKMCIAMRNGVELWIDEEKAKKIQQFLGTITESKFITLAGEFGERTINTADISGLFSAEDMEDAKRRKTGQWKCQWGTWHDKKDKCSHGEIEKIRMPYKEPEDDDSRSPADIQISLANLRSKRDQILGKVKM